jgi:hypothetical protein
MDVGDDAIYLSGGGSSTLLFPTLSHRFNIVIIIMPCHVYGCVLACFSVFAYSLNFLVAAYGNNSTYAHVASSKEECLAKLMEFGFSPEGLPVSLGGSWTGGFEPVVRKGSTASKHTQYSTTTAAAATVTTIDGKNDNATNHHGNENENDELLSIEIETELSLLLRNAIWSHEQVAAASAGRPHSQQQQSSSFSSSSSPPQELEPAAVTATPINAYTPMILLGDDANRKMPAVVVNTQPLQEPVPESDKGVEATSGVGAAASSSRTSHLPDPRFPVAAAATSVAAAITDTAASNETQNVARLPRSSVSSSSKQPKRRADTEEQAKQRPPRQRDKPGASQSKARTAARSIHCRVDIPVAASAAAADTTLSNGQIHTETTTSTTIRQLTSEEEEDKRLHPWRYETEEQKQLRRQRDIGYAKRKRERQRIEIEVLQQQKSTETAWNAVLLSESQRLQELLRAAQVEIGIIHNNNNNNMSSCDGKAYYHQN